MRPTSIRRTPESLAGRLSDDQRKLYELVWKRTLACQMRHALINTVGVDLSAGDAGTFRANGSTVAEPGFLRVYEEGTDAKKDDGDRVLPPLEEGQALLVQDIRAEQHFTEPPPRFSEASLVKALEDYGIGRPSTYASIIGTAVARICRTRKASLHAYRRWPNSRAIFDRTFRSLRGLRIYRSTGR